MATTQHRHASDVCPKCQGLMLTELLRDDDLGAMCQAKRCIPCGFYGMWGPIRGLTWPIQ